MKKTDPKGRWALYASHLGGYMRRWIFRTPWFTVRIHNILRSDEGRDFHDHPFSFVSLILWGGYTEYFPSERFSSGLRYIGRGRYGPGSIVRRWATDLHRLELDRPAWTLVITSRYWRDWGFQTSKGWVSHKDYARSYYNTDNTEGEHVAHNS